MELQGDLRCVACSHFVGEVVVERNGSAVAIQRFSPGPHFSGDPDRTPKRCDKCGGNLYLDEVQLIRSRTVAAAA